MNKLIFILLALVLFACDSTSGTEKEEDNKITSNGSTGSSLSLGDYTGRVFYDWGYADYENGWNVMSYEKYNYDIKPTQDLDKYADYRISESEVIFDNDGVRFITSSTIYYLDGHSEKE